MNDETEATLGQATADLAWLAGHGALDGMAALITERRRQIEDCGYTTEHDQGHPKWWFAKQVAEQAHHGGAGSLRQGLVIAGALSAAGVDRCGEQEARSD